MSEPTPDASPPESPPAPAAESPPGRRPSPAGTSGPAGAPAPRHRPAALPLAARVRRAHAALAPLVLAPLLVTVLTGLGYRLLRDWGGLSRDGAHVLMVVHEGEWLRPWLGPHGETVYVLLNGLGLLWMLATGATMAWQRLRRDWAGSGGKGP